MAGLNKADRILLERIKKGEAQAWETLVERYHGRLLSFARSKAPRKGDAEDLVQDTMISLIQSLDRYRGDASLETYLFTILRRKIIDTYRSKASSVCLIQDVMGGNDEEGRAFELPGDTTTASMHMRRDEERDHRFEVLAGAIEAQINGYKENLNFRDLKILEALLYCRLKNKDVANMLELPEKQVGLIKHRAMKSIKQRVDAELGDSISEPDWNESYGADSMLSDVWESRRLSCPKRSVIGKYHLGALEAEWLDYTDFHLNTLGCSYCRANLEDIKAQTKEKESEKIQQKIMQSTIGFLKKA